VRHLLLHPLPMPVAQQWVRFRLKERAHPGQLPVGLVPLLQRGLRHDGLFPPLLPYDRTICLPRQM
jgi:hypothetical protein